MRDYFKDKYGFITKCKGEEKRNLPACIANLAICLKSATNEKEVRYFEQFLLEQQGLIRVCDESAHIYLLQTLGDYVTKAENDKQQYIRNNQPMLAQDIEDEQQFLKQVYNKWLSLFSESYPDSSFLTRSKMQPGLLESEAPAASAASLSPSYQRSPAAGSQTHPPSAAESAGAQKNSIVQRVTTRQAPLTPRSTAAGPPSRVTARQRGMFAFSSVSNQDAGVFSEKRLSNRIVADREQYPDLDVLYIVNVGEADFDTVNPNSMGGVSLKKVGKELKSDVLYISTSKLERLEKKFINNMGYFERSAFALK